MSVVGAFLKKVRTRRSEKLQKNKKKAGTTDDLLLKAKLSIQSSPTIDVHSAAKTTPKSKTKKLSGLAPGTVVTSELFQKLKDALKARLKAKTTKAKTTKAKPRSNLFCCPKTGCPYSADRQVRTFLIFPHNNTPRALCVCDACTPARACLVVCPNAIGVHVEQARDSPRREASQV